MKLNPLLRVFLLSLVLTGLVFSGIAVPEVSAQKQNADMSLQRGYRTGYSDGYMAGYRDSIDSIAKDYSRHSDYTKADRAYNKEYGSIDDYKDGYKQGFETGYDTGFERRSFEATLPSGLQRRGAVAGDKQQLVAATTADQTTDSPVVPPQNEESSPTAAPQIQSDAIIIIPKDTELILELKDALSTDMSREGQKFKASVVAPSEIAGATVEGHIAKITKSGRFNHRSEMQLSFDRIFVNDSRWAHLSATLIEVTAIKGDNVQRVDAEGTAVGQSTMKKDAIKVGGSTGVGALIGGIAGGPVGVAIGAGVGAAFGVGAVVINRGKQIRLSPNQRLRVQTELETQIR